MYRRMQPVPLAGAIAFLVPLGALMGAYGSQHLMGLAPCHLCLEQRWPHFAALAAALISLFFGTGSRTGRVLIAVAAGGILTSGGIAVFHAGVEAGLWEYTSPCTSTMTTGGNALEAIMAAPIIRCDEVSFRLLGISMAGWNAIISIFSAIAITALLAKDFRPDGRDGKDAPEGAIKKEDNEMTTLEVSEGTRD